jgi:hypothetical protein
MVLAPSGQVTALFLFDVAEEIRLAEARALLGLGPGGATPLRHPSVPPYVRYADPPIQADAATLGLSLDGHPSLGLRVRLYDYGVVSLALTRTCAGDFAALHALAREAASGTLEALATAVCRRCTERLAPALVDARASQLTEDYVVAALVHDGAGASAASLLSEHGTDIARLLRVEAAELSAQERDEVLQHRLSYLANDLVIPSWSGAFVYDTAAGVAGHSSCSSLPIRSCCSSATTTSASRPTCAASTPGCRPPAGTTRCSVAATRPRHASCMRSSSM